MILRDALDIKKGTQQVNKIYKGTYKVWDKNRKVLEGYCKQETTEGRNLIEPKIATGTIKNGITITNNGDGSYILNGTASRSTDIRLDQSTPTNTDNLKNYTAGTYSLSCKELKTGLSLILMQNQTWKQLIRMQQTNIPTTKYIEDTDNVFFYLYIESGATYNNYIIRPQLEKSSTVHDWEPYTGEQPSPNPDYPQEIEVMQGRQIVTIKGTQYIVDLKSKNLFDKDNNAFVPMSYIAQAGTINSANHELNTYYIECKPNTAYHFHKIAGAYFRVGTTEQKPEKNGTLLQTITNNNKGTDIDITTDANAKYLLFNVYDSAQDTLPKQTILDSVQVEEGSEATDYEPYYDYKLAGIGDVKDNICTDKGGWYFEKKFYNKKFNGSETFTEAFDVLWGTNVYMNTEVYFSKAWGKSIANYFRDAKISSITPLTENGQMQIVQDNSIIFKNDDITTAQDFKTWLSTHNTDVWYELETAQKITIPSTYTTLINQLNALYQAM